MTRYADDYRAAYPFFEKLASAAAMEIVPAYEKDDAVSIVTDGATVYIPMADMVDIDKERARLSAEIERAKSDIARTEAKLANEAFVSRAPAAVVEGERAKLTRARETAEALAAALAKLG